MKRKHWQIAIWVRFQEQLRQGKCRSHVLLTGTAELLNCVSPEPPVWVQHSLLEGSPTLHLHSPTTGIYNHPTQLDNKQPNLTAEQPREKRKGETASAREVKVEDEQCRNRAISRNQGCKTGRQVRTTNKKRIMRDQWCILEKKTNRAILKLQNCILYILKYTQKVIINLWM